MEVFVHEMHYINPGLTLSEKVKCIPFSDEYFEEYKKIYNECFYDMRKALEIKPYNFLHSYEQIADKVKDIFLLVEEQEIIGSVACYGNEIDDLVVNRRFQHQGYGRQLLLWGMNQIRKKSMEPITLHVAAWNERAISLYQAVGFEVINTERVR